MLVEAEAVEGVSPHDPQPPPFGRRRDDPRRHLPPRLRDGKGLPVARDGRYLTGPAFGFPLPQTTAMSSPSHRIIGLDLLRCAAIFGVVGAHGLVFLYPHVPPLQLGGWTFLLGYLGHGGFYGVELFFALSGYLIGRILWRAGDSLRDPRELLRFYARRWFRTLPAYALFLAINLAMLCWVFPQAVPWAQLWRYLTFTQTLTGNATFFFSESWSLGVEEWFYFLFPATLMLFFRFRLKADAALLGAGALFYLASTAYRWHIAGNAAWQWMNEPRIVVLGRFDALMVGIFAAWVAQRHGDAFRRHRYVFAALGLIALLCAYVTLFAPEAEQGRLFARTWRFNLVSAGFACLLPWAQHCRTTGFAWLDATVARLACWSYAMYLSHMLFWRLLIERWLPDYGAHAARGWLAFGLLLGLTIGTSALVYRWYERPLTDLRDRFAFSRSAREQVPR